MKIAKQVEGRIGVFQILNQVYVHKLDETQVLAFDANLYFEYDNKSSLWYDKLYIYIFKQGEFKVFDNNFNLKVTLTNEFITVDGSNLIFFDEDNYVLLNHFFDKINRKLIIRNVIYSNAIIYEQENYWGKHLNKNFRLNFPEGIFSNPNKFTCSDILGDTTYWEYECEQGFQAKNSWIVRGDYLLFCINRKGYFTGKFLKININTGVIKWQVDVPYTDMIYDDTQGLFISFWAGNNNGKNYQIIDIDNEALEIGEPNTDFELANVNTIGQLQYLNAAKLFFADNVHSYGNNTVPIKFGCFDIVTKKVDFLQEIPTEYGIQISQIIYNEDKLYIRMTENTLLIYEDD